MKNRSGKELRVSATKRNPEHQRKDDNNEPFSEQRPGEYY